MSAQHQHTQRDDQYTRTQGVQRDKLQWGDEDLFIVDAYNSGMFPLDTKAKAAIDVKVKKLHRV